ncbi:MAG: murein biosynthesis integral membrane protein MurJ, partial [Lysobacter sp.]|nr:murein biosynthesis integral membrane protein MurJ [Lysobacter sp.]
TPVRAGVASLIANMLFNGLFLAILYYLWVPDALRHVPVLVALSKVPGLHFALGLASAAASYLNLLLLWRWLRKAGVYDVKPGWGKFLLRLGAACSAMTLCLLAGLKWAPDFTTVPVIERVMWLGVLVGGGALVYFASMVALGFRLSDLREH